MLFISICYVLTYYDLVSKRIIGLENWAFGSEGRNTFGIRTAKSDVY